MLGLSGLSLGAVESTRQFKQKKPVLANWMKQLVLKVFKTLKKQIWALSLQDFLVITIRDNKNKFVELFSFWVSTIETDLNSFEYRIAYCIFNQ